MNTLSALFIRIFDAPRSTDQSLQTVSMLACFGLALSLGLVGFGFDLGGAWI